MSTAASDNQPFYDPVSDIKKTYAPTPPDQPEDAALREALHDFAISYQVERRDGRQTDIDHMMQLFREQEAKAVQAARMDELAGLIDRAAHGPFSDRKITFQDIRNRIYELQATQPPAADTPQPSNELCFDCGNKTFWYDNAYRCIYDGAWHQVPPAADTTKQGEGE